MARKRTGSLYWTKSGWRARLTLDVDDVELRRSFDLETTDKRVAKIKLKRLLEQPDAGPGELATEAKRSETFEQAADRIIKASGIRSATMRLGRLRKHAYPAFGQKPVEAVTASDVEEMLDTIAADGGSRQGCVHLRNDVSAVLGELWRLEVVPTNVAKKARIPKTAKVDRRERTVLTDGELLTYIAWEHPLEHEQDSVRERQTMACVSRVFGGVRLGDLRALGWELFDTVEGAFAWGWAPRQKTERPQQLEVPAVLRPILRDWWERAGRPSTGPVFPIRRGERAGKARDHHDSPAEALRRDLRRAFGIDERVHVQAKVKHGRKWAWRQMREPTPRETELLEDTKFTRRVDFHSFRRAFKQALADAGVELTQALALSGASDVKAHLRYLTNTSKMRHVPDAALPNFGMEFRHGAVIQAPPGSSELSTTREVSVMITEENRGDALGTIPKLGVASSNLVFRSEKTARSVIGPLSIWALACGHLPMTLFRALRGDDEQLVEIRAVGAVSAVGMDDGAIDLFVREGFDVGEQVAGVPLLGFAIDLYPGGVGVEGEGLQELLHLGRALGRGSCRRRGLPLSSCH
jgi:integrase